MKNCHVYQHQFVGLIPNELQEGILYVSLPYSTVIHLCACGCRREVVTPLAPFQWKLTYDGETISLFPSIGNWNFPCRSHYWLKEGKIVWAIALSSKKIEAGRKNDGTESRTYFEQHTAAVGGHNLEKEKPISGFWARVYQAVKSFFDGR